MPTLPPVTKALILLCTAVFCLQTLLPYTPLGHLVEIGLGLWPIGSGRFMPWQVLTYAFLHGSFLHLFFNMYGLWMFGAELEGLWGTRRYLQFLAVSAITGGLVFLLLEVILGAGSLLIGASGALYGLLLANAMLFPHRPMLLIIPPVQTTMRTFVIVFGLISVFMIGLQAPNWMAEFAHLGGVLGGWLMILYWRGRPPFGGRGRGGPRRLH